MRLYYILFFYIVFFTFQDNLIAQNSIQDQSSELFFQEGMEQVIKSNYSAARKKFETYLSTSSKQEENRIIAQYYLAFSALNLYNNDGEYLIKQFIKQNPTHHKSLTANFELGKFYYSENNASKAIHYFLEAEKGKNLSKEEKNEINFKLGYSLFSKRRFDEAIPRFNNLKKVKSEYYAASNYYAGYIEYELKMYNEALEDLKNAEKSDAYKYVVPYMVSAIYYHKKEYKELLGYVEPILSRREKVTNQNDVILLVADAYYHLENFPKASRYYTHYLEKVKISQIDIPLQYRIGYVAYLNHENELAIRFFKKVASVSKDDLGYYSSYYLGVLYAQSNNKMFALTAFNKSRNLQSNRLVCEESLYQYAKLNVDLGRSDEAEKSLKEYANDFPEGKYIDEVNDFISEVFFESNDYEKAILYTESIKNKTPKVNEVFQKATFHKGVDEFNKSNYNKAVLYFNKSISVPQDKSFEIKAHYWLAETYSIGGKYSDALRHYQHVLWNGKNNASETQKARYSIGYIYYNTKEYRNALTSFKYYVDNNDPQQNKTLYNDALIRLADCYYVSKKYSLAIQKYKESIALSRVDVDYAAVQLGIIYGIEGDFKKAVSSYNVVINEYATSKYYDDALFYLAQLNFENGNFEAAIKLFSLLISQNVNSRFVPYAFLKRASSKYNLQQYEECSKDYKTLISNYSSHKAAQQSLLPLQEVLAIQNKSTDFDQYLTIFKKANPNDESTESIEFEAAKTYYFGGQYELASNKLLRFIDSYPESSKLFESYFYLGELNNRLKNIEKALEYYSLILENKNYPQYNRVVGRMAKLEQEQKRYDNALYYYQKLYSIANNKKEQNNSLVGLMECNYFLSNFDSSSVYATKILAVGSANASDQNKASLYIGKSAMEKGDFELAEDEFLQTLNTAKDANGAEAQYLLGKIFYLRSQHEQSIETLIELNNSYNSYEYWVGMGFLLIVDNYSANEEFFQAKGTLNSIIADFPLPEIVDIAKIKLLEIEALEQKDMNVSDTLLTEKDTTYVDH